MKGATVIGADFESLITSVTYDWPTASYTLASGSGFSFDTGHFFNLDTYTTPPPSLQAVARSPLCGHPVLQLPHPQDHGSDRHLRHRRVARRADHVLRRHQQRDHRDPPGRERRVRGGWRT
jgi:hypothetical protein